MFLIVFLTVVAISLWAQWRVKSVYHKYSQVQASSGATGAQVASAILQRAGIAGVDILEAPGVLVDHYDPTNRTLVLSSENFHGQSVAALGVAAHECGHAIQHQIAYQPLHLRMAAVGAVNFVNPIIGMLPLLMFFHVLPFRLIAIPMVIGLGVIMLFSLVTMPVEFDASRRAKEILPNMGFIGTPEEMEGVRRTLDAAGWTYVAAFIVSLVQLLWWLLPLLGGGRRND